MKFLLNFGANAIIISVQALSLLFVGLSHVFRHLLYRPGHKVLRFFFYRVVVRAYGLYKKTAKRFGFKPNMSLPAVLQQKLIHVMVVSLTVFLIFVNLTQDSRAGSLTENAHKTILAGLIKSEFSGFAEDEQLVIETFDREAVISPTQQTYLNNLSSFKTPQNYNPEEAVGQEFALDTKVMQQAPEIKPAAESAKPRKEIIEYTIQPGDSVSTIAEDFGVSVSTILWENDLSAYSIIRPGQTLKILPTSGITHTVKSGDTISSIVQEYDVEQEEILQYNKIESSNKISIGQVLVIPGGSRQTYTKTQPKTYTGLSAIKSIVAPVAAKSVPANKMYWPAQGTITQYYSWSHHGLDIANKTGTSIYSADAGTVELAGWGKGYGNQIVINHGGGKKTRYAHLSKFYVSSGDKVDKGEAIAAMGSTGWSTGPHLHFEVIINNTKYNPLNYIK